MTEPSTTRIANQDQASSGQDGERQIEDSIASVREALTGLRYGNVSLTVHEGRVVQIDVTEKRRLKPN
ncbi:MAG: YezD family protein [Pseudomonadota bacterium]